MGDWNRRGGLKVRHTPPNRQTEGLRFALCGGAVHLFRGKALLFVLVCGSVLLSVCASASGQKLTGSVRVYGSEPHTWTGIKDERDGRVYMIGDPEKESELRSLQGRRVEFTVKIISGSRPYPPVDGMVSVISYKMAD
jgi:hypothetical protein